jgi:hypothetical protein
MSQEQHRWAIDVVSKAVSAVLRPRVGARDDDSRDSSGARGLRGMRESPTVPTDAWQPQSDRAFPRRRMTQLREA